MAGRHGPTPDPGRRSTVRRALHAAVRVAASRAPRRYGTPRPTVGVVGWCLQRPRTLGRPSRESRGLQGNRWRCRLGTLTRRLLVELNNAELGVSSSAASTGASFRGRAAAAAPPSWRLYHAYTGHGGAVTASLDERPRGRRRRLGSCRARLLPRLAGQQQPRAKSGKHAGRAVYRSAATGARLVRSRFRCTGSRWGCHCRRVGRLTGTCR